MPVKKKPKPRPRRPRAEAMAETREALINAGLGLFAEQGLDAPSLDAICARAGYTRGAFYVHFADRDAFLEAVMERAGVAYLDAVIGAGDRPLDLGETVTRFVSSVQSGAYPLTREGGPRPHQLLDACARSPAVRARYVALIDDTIRRLARAVEQGQKRELLRADLDPTLAASLLLAGVIGAQTMLELRVKIDVGRAAAAVLALLAPRSPVKE